MVRLSTGAVVVRVWSPLHGPVRVLSELRRILTVAAATLVLTWFVGNLVATAVGIVRSHLVAAEVAPVIERALPEALLAQDELVAAAGRPPDRRWIEQACRFTADESGWMALRHRETCVLRTLTAWQVGSEPEARGLLPTHEMDRSAHKGCVELESVGDVDVEVFREVTYVEADASHRDPWCTPLLNDLEGTRALVGQRQTIGPGRWLIVVVERPLLDVAIGCARWTVVLCDPWVRHSLVGGPQD